MTPPNAWLNCSGEIDWFGPLRDPGARDPAEPLLLELGTTPWMPPCC